MVAAAAAAAAAGAAVAPAAAAAAATRATTTTTTTTTTSTISSTSHTHQPHAPVPAPAPAPTPAPPRQLLLLPFALACHRRCSLIRAPGNTNPTTYWTSLSRVTWDSSLRTHAALFISMDSPAVSPKMPQGRAMALAGGLAQPSGRYCLQAHNNGKKASACPGVFQASEFGLDMLVACLN